MNCKDLTFNMYLGIVYAFIPGTDHDSMNLEESTSSRKENQKLHMPFPCSFASIKIIIL